MIAMLLLGGLLTLFPSPSLAHEGEDHDPRVAGTSACSPTELQPAPVYTRLGEMRISPDIAAIGEIVNFRVTPSDIGMNEITIDLPAGEIVDFEPKTIVDGSAEAGHWRGGPDGLPQQEYLVRLRPQYATGGTWAEVQYEIVNFQGRGGGGVTYYVYEDRVPVTLRVGQLTPRSNGTVEALIQTEFEGEHTMVYRTNTGTFRESGGQILTIDAPNKASGIRATLVLKPEETATVWGRSPDACKEDAFELTVNGTLQSSPPSTSSSVGSELESSIRSRFWTLLLWLILGILLVIFLSVFGFVRTLRSLLKRTPAAQPVPPSPSVAPPVQPPTAPAPPPPPTPITPPTGSDNSNSSNL